MLTTHTLRAYDAVQLASALVANRQIIQAGLPSPIFVSADKRLLNAAQVEGLQIDDPNSHP